jgi:glutamate formiminotransferase
MSEKFCLIKPRLTSDVDARLRDRIQPRRGELGKFLILVLKNVNLKTIPLMEISSDLGEFVETTLNIPVSLYNELKRISTQRRASMNKLVNSAVIHYTGKSKSGRK